MSSCDDGRPATRVSTARAESEHIRVTAADFTRNFGQLTKLHRNAPIHITNHGQETHVLLAADVYGDLLQRGAAERSVDDMMPTLSDLGAWIRQGLAVFDENMVARYANPVVHMMANLSDGIMIGRRLTDVLPEVQNTLLLAYLQRALSGGERQTADFPGCIRKSAWFRGDFIPCRDGAMMLLTDITDDVHHYRLADTKVALVNAMEEHGGVGFARVNVRTRIERVDRTLADMLAMPEDRLIGVSITDLVPTADRVAFKDVLETVLSGTATTNCKTRLITNHGDIIGVKIAIAELRGTYGNEGAVLVVTNHEPADEAETAQRPPVLRRASN